MKIASMLGHRFSVISDTNHSIPNKLTFAAERPPPPQAAQQQLLMTAEESREYF